MSSEYGIAISQSGVPIRYAEDYQKTIDTRWKPVGIVMSYDINTTLTGTGSVCVVNIFDHNLGYIPAFVAPRQIPTNSTQSSSIGAITFYANKTSIFAIIYSSLSATVSGRFYLFDFPINEPYDTRYKGITLANTTRSDYGVKMSNGSSVENTDENQLSFNTNIKDLSLAKVDFAVSYESGFVDYIDFTYGTPYPPLVKLSRKVQNNTIIVTYNPRTYLDIPGGEGWSALSLIDNLAFVKINLDGTATAYVNSFGGLTNMTFAYVILRDPSEIAS